MMRQKRLPTQNSQTRLRPQQGAHFQRTGGPRNSSGDSDVLMPGSPRRIRHKHKPSENTSKDNSKLTNDGNNNTVQVDQRQERRCSRGCGHRKSTDEAFVKSQVVAPRRDSENARRRSTGYGYKPSVDKVFIDVPDLDSEEDDSDGDNNSLIAPRKVDDTADQDERARQTQILERQYKKMCNIENVTPCGRFQRQISQPIVDISSSVLGTKDIKGVCVSLACNIHIKDLDLSGNDLSGKGAKYVAEAIRENTSVDELALAHCNIDLEGLKSIAAVFLDMKPMKRLDMSRNKFSVKHAEVVSDVIKKNDYITDLCLSGNEFDDQSGVLLGKAIVTNVGIKKLDLSWNHLRREGAKAVCLALKNNQTIEELDLSWNGLAEEGCKALGEALPYNHTLKDLDISCNRINIFSLNHFLKGLANNDTLQVLRIDQNPLTTDGAIGIMKVLTQSESTQITDIHMIDIPINEEFIETLDELLKVHQVRVYHRDPNRKRITPILRERTLGDYDPAMILFEYMKQENLRLIDLFRTFDTDGSQSVSKEELREGFMTINMPLTGDALETLFEKLDVNDNEQIEYDEVKIGYRNTMKKLRASDDVIPHNEAAIGILKQLVKEAVMEKRAHMKEAAAAKLHRRSSLTAVFQIRKGSDASEYKLGYRKAMRKLRNKPDDPNDGESVTQLKKLVQKALREKRSDEAMVRGYRKRRQRQASLTAVFAVADGAMFIERLNSQNVAESHNE